MWIYWRPVEADDEVEDEDWDEDENEQIFHHKFEAINPVPKVHKTRDQNNFGHKMTSKEPITTTYIFLRT